MEKALIPSAHLAISKNKFTIVFCLLFLMFFLSVAASANSWYIKPSTEIPLRRGQGNEYKILAIVPDGTEVTIVEENEVWAKVVTDSGKGGWILKRFLSQQQPLDKLVKTLQNQNAALKEKYTAVSAENSATLNINKDLQQRLDASIADLTETKNKYQTLLQDNADVITIKQNLEQSRQTATQLQQELSKLSEENKNLKASEDIIWYLAGGGTLILGCIFGMLISKTRKRKSKLY